MCTFKRLCYWVHSCNGRYRWLHWAGLAFGSTYASLVPCCTFNNVCKGALHETGVASSIRDGFQQQANLPYLTTVLPL